MKRLIIIFTALCFILPATAEVNTASHRLSNKMCKKNLPQGTFKKKKDGTIVQYDKNGKKIGTYKFSNTTTKKKYK